MAVLNKFIPIQTPDYDLKRLTDNIEKFTSQLNQEFLRGNLLTDLDVSTSATAFEHKLGRTPIGWFVTDTNANHNVWRTGWDNRTITLDASSSGNISIWVF